MQLIGIPASVGGRVRGSPGTLSAPSLPSAGPAFSAGKANPSSG